MGFLARLLRQIFGGYRGVALLFFGGVALWLATAPSSPKPLDAQEPAEEVIASGRCHVPICTTFDFGDHVLITYAPERPARLRHVPKGACSCGAMRAGRGFNDHLVLAVETADRTLMVNVSVLRVRQSGNPPWRAVEVPTAERLADPKAREGFEEIAFTVGDDRFEGYRVLEKRQAYADGRMNVSHIFEPRDGVFRFRGATQPIVFHTPLGETMPAARVREIFPTVSAQVRLTPTIQFFQFFTPPRPPSRAWIDAMERTAEALDTRLVAKWP